MVKVDQEFHDLIPPLTGDERKLLEESLLKEGCRDALIVWDGLLLDGHNRLEICERHNIPYTTKEVAGVNTREDAKLWIIRNQLARRNLTPFQRAELALKLKPVIAAKAKERQLGGLKQFGSVSQKSDERDTKHELVTITGVSHDTIHKAAVIEEKAPEPVKEKLRKGEVSINRVYRELKREERKVEAETEELPDLTSLGKYRAIMVDPPWQYDDQGSRIGASQHYSTMSLEEIATLPIEELAADDGCHLYLWTTNSFMHEAFHIAKGWGFDVKTILTWVKVSDEGKPIYGMGHYFRNATEHILFAVKGERGTLRNDVSNVILAPRQKHSEKPDAAYRLVEDMSAPPYLEIFSRKGRPGWTVWGKGVPDER